jgi:hypothetical protein
MKSVTTFEAKCAKCKQIFSHPSLGDFVYGESLFYTADGKHQVYVSAFSEFPQRVRALIPNESSLFWPALASLSDKFEGNSFIADLCCPFCSSTEIECWEGDPTGILNLSEVSFNISSLLSDAEIMAILSKEGLNA